MHHVRAVFVTHPEAAVRHGHQALRVQAAFIKALHAAAVRVQRDFAAVQVVGDLARGAKRRVGQAGDGATLGVLQRHGAHQAVLGDDPGFSQAGAEIGLQRELVVDRHHAFNGADDLGGQLARLVVRHVAGELRHAGLHRGLHAGKGRVARQPRGDFSQHALVVLLRGAGGALRWGCAADGSGSGGGGKGCAVLPVERGNFHKTTATTTATMRIKSCKTDTGGTRCERRSCLC